MTKIRALKLAEENTATRATPKTCRLLTSRETDEKCLGKEKVLSIARLFEAKKHALRRRVWFRALNRVERGIIDLTTRYVDEIRSSKLAKVLTAIMEKLAQATETLAERLVRTVGVPLAKKMSTIAANWGNVSASKWAEDITFARYLAFCVAKPFIGGTRLG